VNSASLNHNQLQPCLCQSRIQRSYIDDEGINSEPELRAARTVASPNQRKARGIEIFSCRCGGAV
jgi:hypothetical protein